MLEGPLRLFPDLVGWRSLCLSAEGAISPALQEAEGGDCLNYVGGDRLVE